MCLNNKKNLIRRYDVTGSRRLSNYWWATFSLLGGFAFFFTGLYSYYLNFFVPVPQAPQGHTPLGLGQPFLQKISFLNFFYNNVLSSVGQTEAKLLFFPQGLSMCFYGLIGILLGTYIWFCIFFQIGCGFIEFNKERGYVRIFRIGFPGKNRFIDYTYTLEDLQSICVKFSSNSASFGAFGRGIYMRIKSSQNKLRDIPLDLYSEKTSLEDIEVRAADLSKFLRVSLSIG